MQEDRKLKTKVIMANRALEYIEDLGFNMEKERAYLDTILNDTYPKFGKLYQVSKLKDLDLFLKDLKEYDEYFKLLNAYELIKKVEKLNLKEKLSNEFIDNIIDFINELRSCRFILDDTQKKKIKEIYKSLYNIISKEILYSDDFNSRILSHMLEDEFDTCMINEIVLNDIKELERGTYVNIPTFNLLKENLFFLKSQGVKNFARLDVITRILVCKNIEEIKTRFKDDLTDINKKLDETSKNINNSASLIKQIQEKYDYVKTNLSKRKISESLIPLLLTISLTLGASTLGSIVSAKNSREKLYKVETVYYNSFTDKETTEESWQTKLERSYTITRRDYSRPCWISFKKSYVLNIETFDLTDRCRNATYKECIDETSITSLRIKDEYKKITEEEALTILSNIDESTWTWATEIITTKQDKSEFIEKMNLMRLSIHLISLYALLASAIYVTNKQFKINLYDKVKELIDFIKSKNLAKKNFKFMSLEYSKVLKEYEEYIKSNQEQESIYQNAKIEILNLLGSDYDTNIDILIKEIENKLESLEKQSNKKYSKVLGR